jgi:hypothetical protein
MESRILIEDSAPTVDVNWLPCKIAKDASSKTGDYFQNSLPGKRIWVRESVT